MKHKRISKKQDSAGVHVWLVFMKAFQALLPHAAESIKRTELGDSDFRVLEVLLHKGPLPVNTIGPKVWLTPGSISVAVDRLVKKGLVSRKDHPDDRRVRRVELTPKGRALITRGFGEHAAAMEDVAGVLSKNERLTLLRLLKKLGNTRPKLANKRIRCGPRFETRATEATSFYRRLTSVNAEPQRSGTPCCSSKHDSKLFRSTGTRGCAPFGAALRYCTGHAIGWSSSRAARNGQ